MIVTIAHLWCRPSCLDGYHGRVRARDECRRAPAAKDETWTGKLSLAVSREVYDPMD